MTAVREIPGLRYAELSQGRRFDLAHPAFGALGVPLGDVPIFPQLPSRLAAVMGRGGEHNPQDDDAFFLNLWVPEDSAEQPDRGLPVMVFVHGGAWTTGGGSLPWYSGRRLAEHGAIIVTVNYRLGPVGHLVAGPDGEDLPFEDLLLALRWVQANIGDYGGDPGRVTLVGQSAGGWYAHALSISERAEGLFRRVALLSMGTRRPWTSQRQRKVQMDVAAHLEAAGAGPDLVEAEVSDLLRAGAAAVAPQQRPLGRAPSAWLPVEGPSLPADLVDPGAAGEKLHVDEIYFRNTRDETGTFFCFAEPELTASEDEVNRALSAWEPEDLPAGLERLSPYERLVAASSWAQFQNLPTQLAQTYRDQGRTVTVEMFDAVGSVAQMGSGHCLDLPFQFGTYEAWQDAPMLRSYVPERFEELSQHTRRQLMDFVLRD